MDSNLSWSNPLIVILWVFGWAAFVLIIIWINQRKRQKVLDLIHKERLAAIEKGLPYPEWPDYHINGEGKNQENPKGTLGAGIILAMIGIGMTLMFYLWPSLRILWPVGLVIVFTGLGVMISFFVTRGKEKKS
ncbi:MAG: DUF6249 domain-containing protein [Candidatus Saccharicenans sp.]|nr:DUF6249 domain-containing protein [Candidatus Saccharicenans sp.]